MNKRSFNEDELSAMNPAEFRNIVRREEYVGITGMACRGYIQTNLVVIPKKEAFEFLLFCNRNSLPCPVIDVTEPGDPYPKLVAPEADVRTDLPRYRVYKNGEIVDEPYNIKNYWNDDLVAFLIGGSYSFDWSLRAANVKFRMTGAYITNIECFPAGRFHGPMVVSGRLFDTSHDAVRAIQTSSRHLDVHGPPIHIGDPEAIGIKDMNCPDWASTVKPPAPRKPHEIPMFWGCGITPQTVALQSRIPFMITHWPSHVLVTDRLAEELSVF